MIETLEVYPVPPEDFCKRLYRLDPNLHLNFEVKQKVWQIWCKDPYLGTMDHVMSVVEPDGSYRDLDSRTIDILIRNRYYQQHPELLNKIFADDPEWEEAQAKYKTRAELKHFSNDPALKSRWNKFVEDMRLTPMSVWKKPKILYDDQGEPIKYLDPKTGRIKFVRYKPHPSLFKKD